ncbi:MAG: hypothetical protein ACJAQ9_002238 [Ilumatobacter sp.]|jgi:hypothetical protein
MTPGELLHRLSGSLRSQIGPAVGDEYTRTQAFMASVILERLSKQVELQSAHGEAERADMIALCAQLDPVLALAPDQVRADLESAVSTCRLDDLGPLIDSLYEPEVEPELRDAALGLLRPVLRRDIDRRMAIAT